MHTDKLEYTYSIIHVYYSSDKAWWSVLYMLSTSNETLKLSPTFQIQATSIQLQYKGPDLSELPFYLATRTYFCVTILPVSIHQVCKTIMNHNSSS